MTEEFKHLDSLWNDVKLDICEDNNNSGKVDGVHILARLKGPSFFPNTTSGNGYYYSMACWENVLNNKEFQKRLKNRQILGTIGHFESLGDYGLSEGKASHIVSEMYIENGVGIAEYLIMNTPTGRALNTYIRSNVKFSVSTKCTGYFQPGTKIVIPESFSFERIDFVMNPGYKQASPELLENQHEKYTQGNLEIMDNNTTKEQANLIVESLLKSLSGKINEKEKENTIKNLTESIDKQVNEFKSINESQKKQLNELTKEKEQLNEELKSYKELGEYDDIIESLAKFEEDEKKSKEELALANKNISELKESLNKYGELGTLDELNKVINSSEVLLNKLDTQKIKLIAQKFNIQESVVTKLHNKMDFEEIEECLTEMSKNKTNSKGGNIDSSLFHKQSDNTKKASKINESDEPSFRKATSLVNRLCRI